MRGQPSRPIRTEQEICPGLSIMSRWTNGKIKLPTKSKHNAKTMGYLSLSLSLSLAQSLTPPLCYSNQMPSSSRKWKRSSNTTITCLRHGHYKHIVPTLGSNNLVCNLWQIITCLSLQSIQCMTHIWADRQGRKQSTKPSFPGEEVCKAHFKERVTEGLHLPWSKTFVVLTFYISDLHMTYVSWSLIQC